MDDKLDSLARLAKRAAEQDGVFTRRQADEEGCSWRVIGTRLRIGEWREPAPGVLVVTAAPPTWRQDVRVATFARKGTVASHRAAARLHELDGFDDALVEVLVARPRYAAGLDAIVHRSVRYAAIDLTSVDGIPVTTIARTLCDLGAVVGRDRVEQGLDDALRKGASLRWIRRTLERLERPGRSGTPVLREILNDPRRAGKLPDSWFERLASRMLAQPGLPPHERRYVVRDAQGRVVGELDLAIPLLKVGIEAHSDKWHYGPRRGRRDHWRDRRLTVEGWQLVYLSYADVERGIDATLKDIAAICARRARELGVSLPTGV